MSLKDKICHVGIVLTLVLAAGRMAFLAINSQYSSSIAVEVIVFSWVACILLAAGLIARFCYLNWSYHDEEAGAAEDSEGQEEQNSRSGGLCPTCHRAWHGH